MSGPDPSPCGECSERIKGLEVRLDALDRLMDERARYVERALHKADENNMHWKQHAEKIMSDHIEARRNFWPRSLGILTGTLAAVATVLSIYIMIKSKLP